VLSHLTPLPKSWKRRHQLNLSGFDLDKLTREAKMETSEINRRTFVEIAIAAAALAMYGDITHANEAKVKTVTSVELAALLKKKDFFFVNVHTPYEGEIERTDAFIVFDKIAENLDKLPRDKAAKIILYCRSGRMSEIAARELTDLGFTQVSHLSGGMIDWKKSGHEVIEK
jgi:rhodanese-related sulfurtransferase